MSLTYLGNGFLRFQEKNGEGGLRFRLTEITAYEEITTNANRRIVTLVHVVIGIDEKKNRCLVVEGAHAAEIDRYIGDRSANTANNTSTWWSTFTSKLAKPKQFQMMHDVEYVYNEEYGVWHMTNEDPVKVKEKLFQGTAPPPTNDLPQKSHHGSRYVDQIGLSSTVPMGIPTEAVLEFIKDE
jgi:hypothetical protein